MKKYISFLLFLGLLFPMNSCQKDALDEKVYDFISPSNLEDSEAGGLLLLQGAYTTLNENLFRYDAWPRMGDFDCDHVTGPSWAFGSLGSGQFQKDSWMYEASWNGLYKIIHRANVGIETIEKMTFEDAKRKNIIGQFQVLKAWSYFQLVRMFGGVPLRKASLGAGEDAQQPRASVKAVYDEIIAICKAAEGNLYVRSNPNYKLGQVSKGAASTLMAKAYITMASGALSGAQVSVKGGKALQADGKTLVAAPTALTFTKKQVVGLEGVNAAEYFKLARDKAKEIMDSKEFLLFPTYQETWSIANRNRGEHIFMVQALNGNNALGLRLNTWSVGYLDAKGEVTNGRWTGMRNHWYELFEDGVDDRVVKGVLHRWKQFGATHFYPPKHQTLVTAKDPRFGYDGTENYYSNNVGFYYAGLTKFAAVTDNTIDRSDFHFPLLRYADVVLMFAEAENEITPASAAAYTALNSVRSRSKATDATAGMNQQQFRSFVIEERARELSLEMERRWDLMRWGIYLDVMNSIDVDENGVVKRREAKNLLYPVPIQEINTNKLFGQQNPGW
jgi:starch-binding outer membrane protein, SusD/RagB family